MRVRKKNKYRLTYGITICAFAAAIAFTGTAIAKYITGRQDQELITARDFRFESNYLTESGGIYTVYGDSIEITVFNTDGLTVSQDDVTYTIAASDGGQLDSEEGTLSKNTECSKVHTLYGEAGKEITVTAASASPYRKKLTAKFIFSKEQEKDVYEVEDYGNYVVLHIYTGTTPSDQVTINYGTLLAPDNTDERMTQWINAVSGTLELKANSHYSLIFFENKLGQYSKGETEFDNEINISHNP